MPEDGSDPGFDPIGQNTETMLAFNQHEKGTLSGYQRLLVFLGELIGSPFFFGATVLFAASWITVNLLARPLNFQSFDSPPFPILQGVVSLSALITTVIVLIKQNRLGKMEARRAHLELQVNLLTEQKATKLINLLEELRRDLPMIRDRYDAEAAALQVRTDPKQVLKALDDRK